MKLFAVQKSGFFFKFFAINSSTDIEKAGFAVIVLPLRLFFLVEKTMC